MNDERFQIEELKAGRPEQGAGSMVAAMMIFSQGLKSWATTWPEPTGLTFHGKDDTPIRSL